MERASHSQEVSRGQNRLRTSAAESFAPEVSSSARVKRKRTRLVSRGMIVSPLSLSETGPVSTGWLPVLVPELSAPAVLPESPQDQIKARRKKRGKYFTAQKYGTHRTRP